MRSCERPLAVLPRAPSSIALTTAAALPAGALTAWQALFEHARLQSGQRVLVNGAGGGVGGFTVQFAKQAGATVIATASPRSADPVRAAGADQLVDYTMTKVTDAVREPVDAVVNLVTASEQDMAALVGLVRPGGPQRQGRHRGGRRPRSIRTDQPGLHGLHGSTEYQAWVETLPQSSRPVPLPISAGDSISISIEQSANGQWQIAFGNNTTGKTYQLTVQYKSSQSSAEWVVEAPSARRGRLLPLDTFGTITFSQASAVKDGQTVTVAQAGGRAITMISAAGQALASPSGLGDDGGSFSVLESLL